MRYWFLTVSKRLALSDEPNEIAFEVGVDDFTTKWEITEDVIDTGNVIDEVLEVVFISIEVTVIFAVTDVAEIRPVSVVFTVPEIAEILLIVTEFPVPFTTDRNVGSTTTVFITAEVSVVFNFATDLVLSLNIDSLVSTSTVVESTSTELIVVLTVNTDVLEVFTLTNWLVLFTRETEVKSTLVTFIITDFAVASTANTDDGVAFPTLGDITVDFLIPADVSGTINTCDVLEMRTDVMYVVVTDAGLNVEVSGIVVFTDSCTMEVWATEDDSAGGGGGAAVGNGFSICDEEGLVATSVEWRTRRKDELTDDGEVTVGVDGGIDDGKITICVDIFFKPDVTEEITETNCSEVDSEGFAREVVFECKYVVSGTLCDGSRWTIVTLDRSLLTADVTKLYGELLTGKELNVRFVDAAPVVLKTFSVELETVKAGAITGDDPLVDCP